MGQPLVTIAGRTIPDPSFYNATDATIVDSARNAKGVMIGAVIRESTAKVECRWRYLSAEDWSYILKLFDPRYGGAFINDVTFLNQVTNAYETRSMYVSDRTSEMWLRADDGHIKGWTSCRLALVEV